MRLLVQSTATGRFLAPDPVDGSVQWVRSLREAGGGVLGDMPSALQVLIDNTEFEDGPVIVDLDRLGTVNDY